MKCPGSTDGKGCLNCLKKGVKCFFSRKRKPGPRTSKHEGVAVPAARNPSPATGSTKGMRSRSAEAATTAASGSATLLTPSKKAKATHDSACRAVFTPVVGANVGAGMGAGAGAIRCAADDRSNGGSFLSGGDAPMTPPSFHDLSPSSSAVISHFVPPVDDPLGASRLEGGAGSCSVRHACSGGSQLSRAALQAGGNDDGAGGGSAGPMSINSNHDIVTTDEGMSFISELECSEFNLATLFDQVDMEFSEVWDMYVSASDEVRRQGESTLLGGGIWGPYVRSCDTETRACTCACNGVGLYVGIARVLSSSRPDCPPIEVEVVKHNIKYPSVGSSSCLCLSACGR